MANKELRPGDIAPKSGEYEVVGPRGGHTGRVVSASKGDRLPPTPKQGQKYYSKNSSGR